MAFYGIAWIFLSGTAINGVALIDTTVVKPSDWHDTGAGRCKQEQLVL